MTQADLKALKSDDIVFIVMDADPDHQRSAMLRVVYNGNHAIRLVNPHKAETVLYYGTKIMRRMVRNMRPRPVHEA